MHRSFVEDGLDLAVTSQPGSVCPEEEVRRAQVNFTFKNLEGQDKVSTEASAFQREEVELAKPFLIWHMTKTSHLTCCKALDPLQVVNVSPHCRLCIVFP